MVKKFLKIAGVKNEQEFYKKYPTESAFFKAHPEAKTLKKMKQGGSMLPIFQTDGVVPPFRGGYADNEGQYQNDMDAYIASLGTGAAPIQGPLQQFIPQAPAQAAAQPAPAVAQQQATLNPYTGGSLVDLLKTQGKASDKASRRKLAETLGIDNYTGTYDQNVELMNQIKNNPNIIQDMAAGDLMTQGDLDKYTKSQQAKKAASQSSGKEYEQKKSYAPWAKSYNPRTLVPKIDYSGGFNTSGTPTARAKAKGEKNSNDVKSWWNKTAAEVKAEDPYFFAEENSPGWVKTIDAPFTGMRDAGNSVLLDGDWGTAATAVATGAGMGIAANLLNRLRSGQMPQMPAAPAAAPPRLSGPSYRAQVINPKGQTQPAPNYNIPALPGAKWNRAYGDQLSLEGATPLGLPTSAMRQLPPSMKQLPPATPRGYTMGVDQVRSPGFPLYAEGGGYPYIGLPYHNYDMPMAYAYGGAYDDSRGLVNRGPYEGRALVNAYAYGGMYQMGGAAQQQQPSGQAEELMSAVADMLQKGAQPKQVEGALVKQGVPAPQAKQIVAQVKSMMSSSSAQQMPMAQDGAYMQGQEYDMDENQIQQLERMGYKFDYLD